MSKKAKWKNFTKEEIEVIFKECESYREMAQKLGYNIKGGSSIKLIQEIINKYDIKIENYLGMAWRKNKKFIKEKPPIEIYLNNEKKITSHRLRLRLIEDGIFQPICQRCGNSEWLDNQIPLEIHHKDGNKNNNNLDNLELLCPNCHYFTDTYKTKNCK